MSVFLLAAVTGTIPCRAEPAAPAQAIQTSFEEVWLSVSLNGQPAQQTVLLLRDNGGHVWVRRQELESWRLPPPAGAASSHLGEDYYALDTLNGLTYRIDEPTQALLIEAAAALFERVDINAGRNLFSTPARPPLGGFLNYDVVAAQADGRMSTSAMLEADAFGSFGAGIVRFIERQADGHVAGTRLESVWTRDRPESATTLKVGDSISSASRFWGGAVRFGGVQLASNFATRPDLITFPLPSVQGEAALPSVIDLYVNGALRMQQDVPMGPFSVDDVPVVTGEGDIRLVVRDLLGREQVISQSYYASSRLLHAGLHDYSYEFGAARENYGISSNDYGRPLAVGTHRIGLTDRITGEIHGELLRDQQTLGMAGAFLLPALGIAAFSLAGSHSEPGAGALVSLGLERKSRRISVGGSAQLASDRFTHIGLLGEETAPRLTSQIFANTGLGRCGSIGLGHTRRAFRNRPSTELITARHNIELGSFGYLSFAALRVRGEQADTIFDLSFTRSLGDRTSASLAASVQNGSTAGYMTMQRNLPAGRGLGYRVMAGSGDANQQEGSVGWQNDAGRYEFSAERAYGDTRAQAVATGSFAAIGHHTFASRRIDSSFAIAQVAGQPGVRVYSDNQLVGRTNADGLVLLPALRAYQENQIRIEQADLPLDVEIGSVQMKAVPYHRSGLLLKFPVSHARGALISIVLESGEPLPAGALVQAGEQPESFPTGMRGEVYVTGLAPDTLLRASWSGQSCEIRIRYTDDGDPLPRLGPYVCKGVKP